MRSRQANTGKRTQLNFFLGGANSGRFVLVREVSDLLCRLELERLNSLKFRRLERSFCFEVSQNGTFHIVALTLSAATSFAQSGNFKGFEGAWSGTGTVSLSDGSTERIRCRASYRTDAEGDHLKQTLRCASDS